MTDIQWAGEPKHGNEKYPPLLRAIKKAQLEDPERREDWALIASFEVEMSGRDLANRLGKTHDEFDFISRKEGGVVNVYARLKEGVDV